MYAANLLNIFRVEEVDLVCSTEPFLVSFEGS